MEQNLTSNKTLVKDFLHEQESYKIRGAAFTIWKNFRGIFKEKVIENALKKELEDQGFFLEAQKRIDIYYKGIKVGNYTPDLMVNESILIELKAKQFLIKEDEKQFWQYLRGSQYRLGFLINFGSQQLEIRRRIYDKAKDKYKGISV
jgi:GxxExxY protein